MTKVEKHYSIKEVAALLPFSTWEIRRLIRERKLIAKRVIGSRGTGKQPRWAVPDSELRRFMDAMETTADEVAESRLPAAPAPPPPARPRHRRHRTDMKGIKSFVERSTP